MRQTMNHEKEVNMVLANYQVDDDEWTHAELINQLHEWFERFNQRFKLNVPMPAFGIRKLHKRKGGTYLQGQNQHGLHYEILFNDQHLGSFCYTLEVLLHEQMHLRQHLFGEPPTTKRSGHNDEFRHWMNQVGIMTNRYGHDIVEEGPFTELLREHGIEYEPPVLEEKKKRVKNVKWTCGRGCYEIPIPEGEILKLECKKCNTMMERK